MDQAPGLARLQRRLDRERAARLQAEQIAERSARELFDRQRDLELLETVASASNRARTPEQALAAVLPELCRHLAFVVAQAWIPDQEGWLRCSSVRHTVDESRHGAFLSDSAGRRLAPGEGLPGRVATTGRALWVEDVTVEANFPRAATASLGGLRAGIGLPVALDGEVLAVLECFAETRIEPSEGAIRIARRVGESLGQVFERARGERRLRHESRHDALTGLPNRLQYGERLAEMLAAAARAEAVLAVAVLDLDHFKDVNDTLGHEHGDRLLIEVGRRLRASLRAGDVIARLGGDEFALILPQVHDEAQAGELAGRVAEALREPVVLQDATVATEASVGIALFPQDGEAGSDLLRHADIAMYAAKRARVGHAVYSVPEDPHSLQRLSLLGELRRAIEDGGLHLHYQPKVDIATGRAQGVEALVRWEHPARGAISPGDFIPIAERTGLIRPLTRLVLREAIGQARAWLDRGLAVPVAVNVSTRSLLEEGFPAQVGALLAELALPPELLELEITEGTMLTDPDRARAALLALHDLGVSIAVDDFGTGFSSLAVLKALPVQWLKIDRGFVAAMSGDERDRFIVRATVRLGHDLGMRIVAEGVEDEMTLRALAALGCDTAQGYLFHRPAPAGEVEAWLRDRRVHPPSDSCARGRR